MLRYSNTNNTHMSTAYRKYMRALPRDQPQTSFLYTVNQLLANIYKDQGEEATIYKKKKKNSMQEYKNVKKDF